MTATALLLAYGIALSIAAAPVLRYTVAAAAQLRAPQQYLEQIRAQLPGCDVNGVSGGTNGGWRDHPRYPVIFDIFKTSVYKPFNQE